MVVCGVLRGAQCNIRTYLAQPVDTCLWLLISLSGYRVSCGCIVGPQCSCTERVKSHISHTSCPYPVDASC